jgi:hypothetical protein
MTQVKGVGAYRLMDPTPVERLHGSLGSTRIVELNETVVGPFAVKLLFPLVSNVPTSS